jgi:hypothetical protein
LYTRNPTKLDLHFLIFLQFYTDFLSCCLKCFYNRALALKLKIMNGPLPYSNHPAKSQSSHQCPCRHRGSGRPAMWDRPRPGDWREVLKEPTCYPGLRRPASRHAGERPRWCAGAASFGTRRSGDGGLDVRLWCRWEMHKDMRREKRGLAGAGGVRTALLGSDAIYGLRRRTVGRRRAAASRNLAEARVPHDVDEAAASHKAWCGQLACCMRACVRDTARSRLGPWPGRGVAPGHGARVQG